MSKLMIKEMLPYPLAAFISAFRRSLSYASYDVDSYYKGRAKLSGQRSVLWRNEEFNELYREVQESVWQPYVAELPAGARVLDVGCGVGIVAKKIAEFNQDVEVDGIDFPEMIESASRCSSHERVQFIPATADTYSRTDVQYDLIVSSGCFGCICNLKRMRSAFSNCVDMLPKNGTLLMIDPFHRSNLLARAKIGADEVIGIVEDLGCQLESKSGILFWPFREWLCNSPYTGGDLRSKFYLGERWLDWCGRYRWSDHKVLAFRKKDMIVELDDAK